MFCTPRNGFAQMLTVLFLPMLCVGFRHRSSCLDLELAIYGRMACLILILEYQLQVMSRFGIGRERHVGSRLQAYTMLHFAVSQKSVYACLKLIRTVVSTTANKPYGIGYRLRFSRLTHNRCKTVRFHSIQCLILLMRYI